MTLLYIHATLNFHEVAPSFGQYAKFLVKRENNQVVPLSSQRNAFDLLLANAALQSQQGRPPMLTERNAKDRLYNDLLRVLEEKKLDWNADEIDTQGKTCVRKL